MQFIFSDPECFFCEIAENLCEHYQHRMIHNKLQENILS